MELEENTMKEKLPLITVILIAINVLAYLLTEWKGSTLDADDMIRAGAMYGPAFFEGREYGRIVTHFFLHFGLDHLVQNMVSLLVLGYALENAIGRGWFAFIYMFSGIFAGGISVIHSYFGTDGQGTVSCGASGAIYGLMGALLVLLVVRGRKTLTREVPRFLLYLALSLYCGMRDPGIDNAAHVGGFAGGILVCIFMCAIKCIISDRKGQVVS